MGKSFHDTTNFSTVKMHRSSVLFGPGKPVFRGAPLTITRQLFKRFRMCSTSLFLTITRHFFYYFFHLSKSHDLSMGGGGHNPTCKFVLVGKV